MRLFGRSGDAWAVDLWSSPLFLLLTTGVLLGVSLPLAKLAGEASVPALMWPAVISLGPVLALGGWLGWQGRLRRPDAHRLRYFSGTMALSHVVPNLLLFAVIPKVGTGYAGVMFTLSPVLTLFLSMVMGVRRPNRLGTVGIGLGFFGAVMVALSRGGLPEPASLGWVLLCFCVPVFLAIGNIYRTVDWPEGAHPLELAVGSHAVALPVLFAASLFTDGGWLSAALASPGLIVLQMITAAAMFAVFFRLQAVGGPVYLSQIGYLAAAVGLGAGLWVFGESYGWPAWAGAALIAAGVTLTTLAQRA
jgi:drug/metabolite transporter (DMT)-like permease